MGFGAYLGPAAEKWNMFGWFQGGWPTGRSMFFLINGAMLSSYAHTPGSDGTWDPDLPGNGWS